MNIRKLNDREKGEWQELARDIDSQLRGMKKAQLLEVLENFKCEVEKAEIGCLVVERLLRKVGDSEFHNPLPTRKAVEAMELAFPKFKPRTWGEHL